MSASIRSYRHLVAWQRAVDLGLEVYRIGSRLPSSEHFGLRSQSQRAAVSIAANIAEGYGRGTRLDYLRFLHIARGSLRELETHLHFIERLEFVPAGEIRRAVMLCDRTGAVLDGLIRSLKRNPDKDAVPLPAPRSPRP